ncbi:MAG: HAD family hydrolase [Cyanobium sp. CACIAM 14]|nr:MAG: HAD family hydrolase [Cyanobium sp. CACIAM 14]
MPERPLLVFDFDGVLVDGMAEYWWSARRAALALAGEGAASLRLPEQAPAGFSLLRPLIHKGWEMVLMAAELGRPGFDLDAALAHYDAFLPQALARWGWTPYQLQRALERLREEAIAADLDGWLALHRFYPGVQARLERLSAEGADWAVLTTKGGAFAARLLAAAGLRPLALFGHEQGSKASVLARLAAERDPRERPLWFVEDRRPTLELVRRTPGLEAVRCYLVAWGYLGPGDGEGLDPLGIRWLESEVFEAPLAQWP